VERVSKAKPIEQAEAEAGQVVDNVVDLPNRTAAEHRDTAIAFVKEHSGLAIAGGVAVGILVALLLPRRSRKPSKRAAALAEAVSATAVTLGRRALKRSESAGVDLRRGSERAVHRSEELGTAVVGQLGAFLHGLLDRAEDLGETASEHAGKVGKIAAKQASKASEAVEDAAVVAGRRIGKAAADAKSRIIG
jgi:hypothetical protein